MPPRVVLWPLDVETAFPLRADSDYTSYLGVILLSIRHPSRGHPVYAAICEYREREVDVCLSRCAWRNGRKFVAINRWCDGHLQCVKTQTNDEL